MFQTRGKPDSGLPLLRRVVIGGAAFLVIILVLFCVFGWASTARWQRYATRLRAGGTPLTFEEIEAQRLPVPEGANGARVVERLASELSDVKADGNDYKLRWTLLVFGGSAPDVDFFKGIPRYAIGPSREFLEARRGLLDQLSELQEKPTGRFQIEYLPNPYSVLLPHLPAVWAAAQLMLLDATMKLIEGDGPGAAESILLQFRLASTLHDEPIIPSRIRQMLIDHVGVNAIENMLRVGELDEPGLRRLTAVIDERLAAVTMKWSLLGARAGYVGFCEGLTSGQIGMESMVGARGPGGMIPAWLPDTLVRQNQMRGAQMFTRLIDATDDPKAMLKAARRIDREIPALPKTQIITGTMMPSLTRAVELHQRSLGKLRCARVALAAEEARLKIGELPDSIPALVPEYLDKVPADPVDGKPLRFASTRGGIVIYSIGHNGSDDGGSVVKLEGEKRSRDVGLRLNALAHRGLVITDDPMPGHR